MTCTQNPQAESLIVRNNSYISETPPIELRYAVEFDCMDSDSSLFLDNGIFTLQGNRIKGRWSGSRPNTIVIKYVFSCWFPGCERGYGQLPCNECAQQVFNSPCFLILVLWELFLEIVHKLFLELPSWRSHEEWQEILYVISSLCT